jgi:hypothetical protein
MVSNARLPGSGVCANKFKEMNSRDTTVRIRIQKFSPAARQCDRFLTLNIVFSHQP